ncbi:MAG: hypothetical protein Q4C15_08185 [Eubacteriales bacterium]|nr:hypothetical protein [Eubacteriales bacterium]
MKLITRILHIAADLVIIFALAGIPVLMYCDLPVKGYDAVSSASIELPDSPSGEFLIIINRDLHEDTAEDWKDFFEGDYLKVIFEDINCLVPDGDVTGLELANRYMAILPENQMRVSGDDAVLIASKLEAGYVDIAILSADMADALGISTESIPDNMLVIKILEEGED